VWQNEIVQHVSLALGGLGTVDEDRFVLPRAIMGALAAEWIAFRGGGEEWAGLARGAPRSRFGAAEASRRIDFGLLNRLPGDRLVRLAGPSLARSQRFTDAAPYEVLVYVESVRNGLGNILVIALGGPLRVDPESLDAIVRTWLGLTAVRSKIGRAVEIHQQAEREARAACALHDLRHELAVATLELDRISTGPAPVSGAAADRIRTAIARARALCELELEPVSSIQPSTIRVDELLRTEGNAARSVSGRGNSIGVEVRCETGLEFSVDRGMLSRIVRNLVLNGIESSMDGECVQIEAEVGPHSNLVLRVIDRGRGMSAVDRENLSRFGRSGRGGPGIGSASIATCARRIGGSVRVESRLGEGTCVEVIVPSPRETAKPTRPAPQNPPTRAGTRG